MFRVPSSAPSTPDSRRQSENAPSTTPAGPPPDHSLLPSSTPAGPPPATSSVDGSSRHAFARPAKQNYDKTTVGTSSYKTGILEGVGSGSLGTSTSGRPVSHRGRTISLGGNRMLDLSASDILDRRAKAGLADDDDDDDEEMEEDIDNINVEESLEEDGMDSSIWKRTDPLNSQPPSVTYQAHRSQDDVGPVLVHTGVKQSQFNLLALAKGLTPAVGRAVLREPDEMILETERLLEKLHSSLGANTREKRVGVLARVVQDMLALWWTLAETPAKSDSSSSYHEIMVGLLQATRLASLMLVTRHPPIIVSNERGLPIALNSARSEGTHCLPVPKLLLDWLNKTCSDVPEVELVLNEAHGYSKNVSFWEAVHVTTVRGRFAQTLQLLQGARLEVAESAQHDGLGHDGYTGSHLHFANTALRSAFELLRECPAVAVGNWHITGHDWTGFRRRTYQAYLDLQELAEGDSASRQSISQPFQASHFGITQSQASFQLSVASRRAESRVPWSVYENLRKLYQLLLGNEEEILTISADWIEAALCLTIWWNGEEEHSANRASVMPSQRVRPVDVTPVEAYHQHMSSCLAAVIENSDEDFSVNTTDRFEVGLACIMDNNTEAALQIIQSLSFTIASASAELGNAGGWFAPRDDLMDHFDPNDFKLLNHDELRLPGLSNYDLQLAYSNLLVAKGQVISQNNQCVREGWDLAIQVLGRLDDNTMAKKQIQTILDDLPLQSAQQVDQVLHICHSLGLSSYASSTAQRYADHLCENTTNFGDTLVYYARAHNAQRIQDVLHVLVAHCLIKSIAYPSRLELDASLASLITSPKEMLGKLAKSDSKAALLLSNHFSGYATIRKFYDFRDEEVLVKAGEKSKHQPLARKRAAAHALMAAITSASSSIRGGLYDPEAEAVVPVDLLLSLLGEALILVNGRNHTFTLRHLYNLLAAIEDMDTAPGMIRKQCEEVLRTTLFAAHHPSPDSSDGLQKPRSNVVTISDEDSFLRSVNLSSKNGAAANKIAAWLKDGQSDADKRGWDWRSDFKEDTAGKDILRILRRAITSELARAFAKGIVIP